MKKRVSNEHVVILKDHPKSLARVEAYLRARDWKVETIFDVRAVVDYLMTAEVIPKYILIGLDHSQKQVQYLPALVSKQFGVTVIAYFESNALNQSARAEKLGITYVAVPPISGPAVERIFNKVRIDEERNAELREKQERAHRAKLADELKKGLDESQRNVNTSASSGAPAEKSKTELIFTERNLGKAFNEIQKGAPSLARNQQQESGQSRRSGLGGPASPGGKTERRGTEDGIGGGVLLDPTDDDVITAAAARSPDVEAREMKAALDAFFSTFDEPGGQEGARPAPKPPVADASPDEAPDFPKSGDAENKRQAAEISAEPVKKPRVSAPALPPETQSNERRRSNRPEDEEGPIDIVPERKKANLSESHSSARARIMASLQKNQPTSEEERALPVDPLDVFEQGAPAREMSPAEAPLAAREPALEAGPVPVSAVERQIEEQPSREDLRKTLAKVFRDDSPLESAPPKITESAPVAPNVIALPTAALARDIDSIDELLDAAIRAVVDEVFHPESEELARLERDFLLATEIASMELVFRGQTTSLVGYAGKQSIELLENLKKSLNQLLAGSPLAMSLTDPKTLKVPAFDFRRWGEEKCRSMTIGTKDREAVGVASFSAGQPPHEILTESLREGLWRFNLEDLWVDVVLDFEVHLHFPANRKFLLYLKKGDLLAASRKSRLRARGISEVHIQFTRVEDLDSFFKQYQLMKSVSGYAVAA